MTTLYIDISGKQEYIFQSNQLKINIGASYIMAKHITEIQVVKSLNAIEKNERWTIENIHNWREKKNDEIDRIIFIGGGSALLLFDEINEAIAFNKHFSQAILQDYPGIYVNLTLSENVDLNSFQSVFAAIKKKQASEINQHSNFNDAFMFGLEEEDHILGKPVTHFSRVLKDTPEVSQEVITKVKGATESETAFKSILIPAGANYTITNEMDEIVPEAEKGYVAVVHVDGNGFGKMFNDCETLSKFREKSIKLEKNLADVLKHVFKTLADKIDSDGKIIVDEHTEIQCKKNADGKWIVPFRPIINAGDDITFVAHGRLGFYLAELYLKEMQKEGMYACAGVAIVHTKFPFYKAYKLAEELCQQGKTASRNFGESSSWLQVFRATSNFSGNLEQIIKRQFNQNFKDKPYLVCSKNLTASDPKFGMDKTLTLEKFYAVFDELKNWNNTKILSLRDALNNEETLADFFTIEAVKKEDNSLNEKYQKELNILFDTIELRGFVISKEK
jgi:hypothetical protein